MKIKDLENGKMYTCQLSGKKTLVVMQKGKNEIPSEEEGGESTFEETEVVTGKIACVNPENGDVKYFFNEIYDGQLSEIED